ncbi:hypothetical protein EIP91_011686 [Steccherinum ochraceum]|uniref:Uncharacterized protein n=1 Tax=Steccherinum ochraceum TaxID=92696 RepID=A0A4R0S1M5_9APHY|nr:hypothetical protein EIP91_011686 [Steccherinum ochraceum]
MERQSPPLDPLSQVNQPQAAPTEEDFAPFGGPEYRHPKSTAKAKRAPQAAKKNRRRSSASQPEGPTIEHFFNRHRHILRNGANDNDSS